MGWAEWIRTVEIEPSLYAADFARLGEQVEVLLRTGARIFHFDIGDGHFVPPITVGPVVLQSVAPIIHREGGILDCHLMIETPEKHFAMVRVAGGDSVTVHFEICPDLPAVVAAARVSRMRSPRYANASNSPATNVAFSVYTTIRRCFSDWLRGPSVFSGSPTFSCSNRDNCPRVCIAGTIGGKVPKHDTL